MLIVNRILQRFFISDYLFAYLLDINDGTKVLSAHTVFDTVWDADRVSPHLALVKGNITI